MMGVAAFVALVFTIPALLLGHQGQDWPLRGVWRWLRMPRAARCAPAGAPRGVSRLPGGIPGAPGAADGHTARPAHPAPSWAHTQPTDIEEAA